MKGQLSWPFSFTDFNLSGIARHSISPVRLYCFLLSPAFGGHELIGDVAEAAAQGEALIGDVPLTRRIWLGSLTADLAEP
ncbi:hypothetical protein [Jidongwangia harbinensis]|uniref:hypothetical protein n=1 Tax=Jidongwangia harbinensis TaxID=2878561 RepID=UPI001CD96194|nr:hypothetical protein [Jidongwangia harbinensis]MCA2219433.1 hypothetical protein [Jidongwangia harbinensis]